MTVATSTSPLQSLAAFGGKESTKTVLRVIILALIAGAAIASRLFSVIRESTPNFYALLTLQCCVTRACSPHSRSASLLDSG